MIRKLILLITVISMIFSFVAPVKSDTEPPKYEYPQIKVQSDTYIRGDKLTTNYKSSSTLFVDSSSVSHGIAFVEFALDGFEGYIEASGRVYLRLVLGSDAGKDSDNFSFAVIPLEGEYKNIDLESITYTSAASIRSEGVSILSYMPECETYPALKNAVMHIDVTDYLKGVTDGRAIFMIKSTKGKYSFHSDESLNINCGPILIIENAHTDASNEAFEAAKSLSEKYDGMKVSQNIDFDTDFEGYTVTYESSNLEIIDSEGNVSERPESFEGNEKVKFKVYVTSDAYPQITESSEFSVTVLSKNTSLPEDFEISDNSMKAEFSDCDAETKKAVLSVNTDYFANGEAYRIIINSSEATDFIADTTKSAFIFGVTDLSNFDSFEIKGNINDAFEQPILIGLSDPAYDALMKLYNSDLGDLRKVTSDLNLAERYGDYRINWHSSNPEYLSDDGKIKRAYEDGKCILTSRIEGDDFAFELSYDVTVARQLEDEPSELYPRLEDPYHMSDEEFFGKWDINDGTWEISPVLQYQTFSDLKNIENASKNGDYVRAKSLLLSHYRSKKDDEVLAYDANHSYNFNADAMNEKIWSMASMDRIIGEATAGNEWDWISIDLTGSTGNTLGAYWIMDTAMDGTELEFHSRENENPAFLEITINGQQKKYPVVADTYISAGDNINQTYGTEPILFSREAAGSSYIPFGTDTKRSYLKFDLSDIGSGDISSVKLNIYAKASGNKPKKIYCLNTNLLKNFDENTLCWDSHYPEAFCFKETGFLWRSILECRTEWNTEAEWINYSTRLDQNEWLLRRYIAVGNESYAYRALESIVTMYTQQPQGLYPRALDTGWRVENHIKTLYTTINSEHMTPEIFTAILKYLYTQGDALKDINLGTTNQDSAVKVNFARICAFCPEISQDGWWNIARGNLYNLYISKLLNEDGSYTEACSNYITGVIDEFVSALEIIKAREGAESEYYKIFKTQFRNLLTYYINLAYSGGTTPPFGDGSRLSVYSGSRNYNEILNDEELWFIITEGDDGEKPTYTSRLYPDKAVAMLKSGWHGGALSAFLNNDGGGSHGHYDDLALDVSAFGELLLVDAGVSTYSEGSDFANNRRKTLYHNTIEIDNRDQEFNSKGNNPGYMRLISNESFDFLHAGSYDKMYKGFDIDRKVFMLKNKYIIVSDIINPRDSQPHTYRQLWHPDYNLNMRLDTKTNTAQTTHSTKPNIKIIPSDTDCGAMIFDRLMYAGTAIGETKSKSVQYYYENVTGPQMFTTVLYPMEVGGNADVRTETIKLSGTLPYEATAMMVKTGETMAYYYRSDEATVSERIFDAYSYNGESAYIETDKRGNVSYIALINGSCLMNDENILVKSGTVISDLAVTFESKSVRLVSSGDFPEGGLLIAASKEYDSVLFNGREIEFEYSGGFITSDGSERKAESTPGQLKPGTPSSAGKGSGNNGISSGIVPFPPMAETNPHFPENDIMFADCKAHWAKEYILKLAGKGIVSGGADGNFDPDKEVTRAEFTKLVVKSCGLVGDSGEKAFSDVLPDSWYAPYVQTAYQNGIVSGYEDGSFRPGNPITREEMAKMLCAAADILKISNGINADITFVDKKLISDWAYLYVKKAYDLKLVEGDSENCFNPHKNATRAESAVVFCRLLNL